MITDELMSALSLAKSEAVTQNLNETVCPAPDNSQTTCQKSADWSKGWIAFVDIKRNGMLSDPAQRLEVSALCHRASRFQALLTISLLTGKAFWSLQAD